MKLSFTPYEELSFSFNGTNTVTLLTPWRRIEVMLNSAERLELQQLILRRDEIPATTQRQIYARLFHNLRHEPLFSILPRTRDDFRHVESPPVRPMPGNLVENCLRLRGLELHPVLLQTLNFRRWKTEEILKRSRISQTDLYDPVALFSLCRHAWCVDASEMDRTQKLEQDVEKLNNTGLFHSASMLVSRQNDELLRQMHDIILSAFALCNPEGRGLLQIKTGVSGALLDETLKGLSFEEKIEGLLPLTEIFIDAFRRTAQANLLAFALAIEFFRHPSLGAELAETMPPVSEAYAVQTVEVGETLSRIFNSFTASLLVEIQHLANSDAGSAI